MKPYYQDEWVTQYCCNTLNVLPELPDMSVDLLVTDPPYGIGFMGKDWDKALPDKAIWRECLRVLKAGSFAFVMSIPRSDCLSRMIISLEDVGFNVGFTPIYWAYASGFPKSLHILRACDKMIEKICQSILTASTVEPKLSEAPATLRGMSIVVKSVDISTEHIKLIVAIVEEKSGVQSALAIEELSVLSNVIVTQCEQSLGKIKGVEVLKIELGNVKSLSEQDISVFCAELIESWKHIILNQLKNTQNFATKYPMGNASATNVIITKSIRECLTSSTVNILEKRLKESVKHLEGSYSFQPKPAVEVIIVAMKPLSEKTFVDQALLNRKGITWLDEGRIPYESEDYKKAELKAKSFENTGGGYQTEYVGGENKKPIDRLGSLHNQGRFPANLLVSDDVLNVKSRGGFCQYGATKIFGSELTKDIDRKGKWKEDIGSFSRYFDLDKWAQKTFPFLIVPKASKSEKNRGLSGSAKPPVLGFRPTLESNPENWKTLIQDTPYGGANRAGNQVNNHPTVKPLKLMSYLITLGSGEGDTVLDPFVGSGTTLLASKLLNRHSIGIEIEEKYCEIAANRCSQMVMELAI